MIISDLVSKVLQNRLFDEQFLIWQKSKAVLNRLNAEGTAKDQTGTRTQEIISENLNASKPDFDLHPLFDSAFYLEKYPDVRESGVNPLAHYLMHGAQELRQPNILFDVQYYVENNQSWLDSGLTPLGHYIANAEPSSMRAETEDALVTTSIVAATSTSALAATKAGAGTDTASALRPHRYFDSCYYNACYSDVRNSGFTPFAHYLRIGRFENRRPCAEFDTLNYLNLYPDVMLAGIDPAHHFLQSGKAEGRNLTAVSTINKLEYSKLRALEWQLLPLETADEWTEGRLPRRDVAGTAYLELAKKVVRDYDTLVLCNEAGNLSSFSSYDTQSTEDNALIISLNQQSDVAANVQPNQKSQKFWVKSQSVCIANIAPDLSSEELKWLITKFIVQTAPAFIHDVETSVLYEILKSYNRQIKLSSTMTLHLGLPSKDADGRPQETTIKQFNSVIEYFDVITVPTVDLRDQLISQFALNSALGEKIQVRLQQDS
jgi:hypothetical protein